MAEMKIGRSPTVPPAPPATFIPNGSSDFWGEGERRRERRKEGERERGRRGRRERGRRGRREREREGGGRRRKRRRKGKERRDKEKFSDLKHTYNYFPAPIFLRGTYLFATSTKC